MLATPMPRRTATSKDLSKGTGHNPLQAGSPKTTILVPPMKVPLLPPWVWLSQLDPDSANSSRR